MDYVTFREAYAEFKSAPPEVVLAALRRAATELNPTEIGAPFDEAHGLLTAHKLAISPYGRASRTVNDAGETTYEVEFGKVMRRAITALSVTGGTGTPGTVPGSCT